MNYEHNQQGDHDLSLLCVGNRRYDSTTTNDNDNDNCNGTNPSDDGNNRQQ